MRTREEILSAKREAIKRLRSDPAYKEREKNYSKSYRSRDDVKRKKVLHQISYERKFKFGVTREDYNLMFQEQEGCCGICRRHQSLLRRGFAVDHDHKTGKVRGLLCINCNIGLGNFKDNEEFLLSAVNYLQTKGNK